MEMEEGNTIAERLHGSSDLMDVDIIKNSPITNGATSESFNSTASTSNSYSSPSQNGTLDGHFKTPAIPQKKTIMPLKKNLATLELDNSSKDVTGLATELASKDLMEDTKSDQPKLPATACPNSKKYFSERHPTLTTKSVVDTNQDLFEELIVDEFSLIFFNSIDDYKVFKVQEDQVLKREREEEEIRRLELAAEESARQVKIKKRGRKSKAEIEREQRILRKEERRKIREKRRLRRENLQLRRERGELEPKQETPEQKERKEQRLREREERRRLRKEEHEKKKLLKLSKKSHQHHLQNQCAPAIGISEAQKRRLEQQLYLMRKPSTPHANMEEILAAAAFISMNPEQSDVANAMIRNHIASLANASALEGTSQSTSGQGRDSSENGVKNDLSRPDSTTSGPKRPTSTASSKRPLSVLDSQQLNGPTNKMMKMDDDNFRREWLAMQQASSRRSSLQNQQIPPRLNYSPFVGMQPMLNGMLQPSADPNFRFAVPQMPIGVQRPNNSQMFDANQLAALNSFPFTSLLQPSLIPPSLNPTALALARSQANSISTSIGQQSTSSVLNKPFTNPASAVANNAFAQNPEFLATLQQALSAMNAVDPNLLSMNQQLLGMGAQALPGQSGLSLMSQINEAQKQLEQLNQQRQAAQRLQQQSRTAQIPQKMQMDNKKPVKQSTPRQSQNPSTSNTPGLEVQQSGIGVVKSASNPNGSVPVAIVGPNAYRQESSVQATVPLNRPITPSFASSIGLAFPPGTALASQLAGATKMGGKATFASRPEDRWNRMHINMAETLQKLFADNPEMDDGSREGQTCAQVPKEWRVGTSSKVLNAPTPVKNDQDVPNNVENENHVEASTSDANKNDQTETIQSNGVTPKSDESENSKSRPQTSFLPQTNPQIQELAQARLASSSNSSLGSQTRAPIVVAAQQAQSAIEAQEAQKAAIQQQILAASQAQNRQISAGFPIKPPVTAAQASSSNTQIGGIGQLGSLTSGVPINSDSARLMNLFYQQNAQEQMRNMQAAANREMAKKSNASTSLRIREEEQKQMQQASRQPMMQSAQTTQQLAQNMNPSAQLMLQQLIANQQNPQMQALATNPNSMLENLILQSQLAQSMSQQRPSQIMSQIPGQATQNPIQRNPQSFPTLQSQMAQSITQPANIQSLLSSARPGQIDPNQLLALQLIQHQAQLEAQVAANRPQTSQLHQLQQSNPTNVDVLRQMMLGQQQVGMNSLLQNQALSQQNQQQLQLANQLGLAPINPNQLASLMGQSGLPNLLEGDILMRQISGQQPPTNLQRSAQDRQQKAEEHRQFREQLIAAANSAPNTSGANQVSQNLYQLATLQPNGQFSAAQLASIQQQQALLKNPIIGTPQKN